MTWNKRRIVAVARSAALAVVGAGALYAFGRVVNHHYPVKEWMFWVYAKVWTYCLLFAVACLSLGNLATRALGLGTLALRERLVFTAAAGIWSFFALMFVGGLLGLLRPWFAIAMPFAAIAAGIRPMAREGLRIVRHVRARRARGVAARPWWTTPVIAAGVIGTAVVYYAILSPQNVAFDSHFYHLGIAQQYATEHAIRPFREGWVPGALPQLASVLYTWAFTLPGFDMFERIECAAHIEFVVFLMTLATIPVLVRYLVPRARVGASWVALFLFPGIFVYDSGLSVAADHIAAFWAVPSYLAFRRAYHSLDTRSCVLLALCLSGAILTKYQAMYILAFPVAALLFRALYLTGRALWDRHRRNLVVEKNRIRQPGIGLAAAAGAGLLFTAPHWAKNLAFYGDPLFPFLHRIFKPTRWVPETGMLFDDWRASDADRWIPKGTTTEKLKQTFEALATFSFEPHDYSNFHGKVPVFGSLFTLSVILLPFVKGARRTWSLVAATNLGVFIWFWTMHQDRYLQLLVPWMAAVTAATIALAWRSGWVGRVASMSLVGFQMVWGGDAYLIPAHAMTKKAPVTTTNELLAGGYKKQYEQRFKSAGNLFTIGASKDLPADARILLHENNPRLGLWRPVVADIAGWQFALRYELFESPAALDDALRKLKVTHIVSRVKKSRGVDCLGADLRFLDYLQHDARHDRRFGELALFQLPASRPEAEVKDDVAYLGCGKQYERGLYKLKDLSVREKQKVEKPPRKKARKRADTPAELLAEADFAVTDSKCKNKVAASDLEGFVKIGTRNKEELWARRRDAAPKSDDGGAPSGDSAEDEDQLLQ
ncbi:MAG: hypothetical protein HOW73_30675 [Polyangiaceae bacterium]|nr:hypothetical protein [Polyangiaceae bacterium]